MNDSESLEKVAGFLRTIRGIYDALVEITNRVEVFAADEETGHSDHDFARETLSTQIQKIKERIENTPPPFPPPLDGYGLPPIPAGAMVDEKGDLAFSNGDTVEANNELEIANEWAFDCWMQLESDLTQLEGEFFGGSEAGITGESAFPLLQLAGKNSAKREIYRQKQRRIAAFEEQILGAVSDAARMGEDMAKEAQKEAEGARDVWKGIAREERAKNEKIQNGQILQIVSKLSEMEKNPFRLSVMIAGIQARFMPGWQSDFAREKGKKPQQVSRAHAEAMQRHEIYRKVYGEFPVRLKIGGKMHFNEGWVAHTLEGQAVEAWDEARRREPMEEERESGG